MESILGWVALGHIALYLCLFYLGGTIAERDAGRSIWMLDQASGCERIAAVGFRMSFAIPIIVPFVFYFSPTLSELDPIFEYQNVTIGGSGLTVAAGGMTIAFAAQMTMGTSWRVGVMEGATGDLISGGLYRLSRNPTFLGHLVLLIGAAMVTPAIATVTAVLIYWLSARFQIAQEEKILLKALGEPYRAYLKSTPRWFGFVFWRSQ